MWPHRPMSVLVACTMAAAGVQAAPIPVAGAVGEDATQQTFGQKWTHGFVSSLSMILVSEIGDKTFFIAAVMAMRQSQITVYAGAISALAVMTILSVALGYTLQAVPVIYTWIASIGLFLVFGLKMGRDAYTMDADEGMDELEEVTNEINDKDTTVPGQEPQDVKGVGSNITWILRTFVGVVFAQAFTMTFFAEWGDRSQIATIALGASTNPYAVTIGGILGHGICTLAAVLGGRMLAQRISVKHVTIIGAIVFMLFALHSFLYPPEGVNVGKLHPFASVASDPNGEGQQ